jgi:hypothetical protein
MTLRSLAVLLSLAACGDDLSRPAADADPLAPDGGSPPESATAFVVGTDFVASGIASTIDLTTLAVTPNAVDGVASTDPVVRFQDGRILIVNRFGHDNVTVLDASSLQLVAQVSTGAGSNPQDVVADGDTLYVATMTGPGLAVVGLAGGEVETIDLSDLDPDGEPNCSSLALVERRLAVVCGIMDESFAPRRRGRVAVLDIDSRERLGVVRLQHTRPFGFALPTPVDGPFAGDLLVSTVPNFFQPGQNGCVERVPVLGALPAPSTCLIDNQDLGGFASGLAYHPERIWLAVTTGFDPDDFGPIGYAAAWDSVDGAMRAASTSDAVRAMDIAVCPTGEVVVADATRGMRVYDGDELTTEPLDVGLPPVANGVVCY